MTTSGRMLQLLVLLVVADDPTIIALHSPSTKLNNYNVQ